MRRGNRKAIRSHMRDMFGGQDHQTRSRKDPAARLDRVIAHHQQRGTKPALLTVYPDQHQQLVDAGKLQDGRYTGIPVVVVSSK